MPTRAPGAAKLLTIALSAALLSGPASATCGGGGGGGVGGTRVGGSSASDAESYHVAWTVVGPSQLVPGGSLGVLWFPSSATEAKGSNLLTSRTLSVLSSRCLALALVTPDNSAVRKKYGIPDAGSGAVLIDGEAAEIGRVDGLPPTAGAVEKILEAELDKRESAAKTALEAANEKIRANDVEAAAPMLTEIWQQHCLLPDVAKKAAKALKKIGRPVDVGVLQKLDRPQPDLSPGTTKAIVRTMNAGLAAERDGQILEAAALYKAAMKIDPADPTPVRFLGELYRHEIGDWVEARALFDRVLAMPADPLARAVALHGLGKMTIHDGRFNDGVALFHRSLEAFPLPLTYRNLAVYWNSEGEPQKAYAFVKQAIELDPDDIYNQIFAATYLVGLGRRDEAREIALRHEWMLAASYNLAVIHTQLGDKAKALELLRRHFYIYEKFDAVRAKEMQEARDDIAFVPIETDPEFMALTDKADRGGMKNR